MKQKSSTLSLSEINALNREAWALRNADLSEMRALSERAKAAAETIGYAEGVAQSLVGIAFAAYRSSDYAAAAAHAAEAIWTLDALKAQSSQKTARRLASIRAHALNTLGLTHWHRSDFPNALALFQEALSLAEQSGDKIAQAMSANHVAIAYREMGDFASALDYHLKCKTLAEAANERYMHAGALNNIGVVYRRISDFKEALAHFIESNRLYKELGNQRAEATTLGNIGTMQIELGDPAAALASFQTALAIHTELGAKFDQTTSLLGIARAYAAMNNARDAETYFKKCLTLIGVLGDDYAEAEARLELGKLYQRSSQKKAIAEFAKALPLAEKVQARDLAHQLHAALARSYKESGEHLKAIEHLEQAHKIEREIYNEQSDRRLKNLQTLYNLDAARRAAELERKKRERAERDLAQRRGEILRLTTFLAEKNQLLESIRDDVLRARTRLSTKKAKDNELLRIGDRIAAALNAEKDWKGFEALFNEAYPDFIASLSKQFPSLTKTQLIICALIRLNLSSKDIAKILYASDVSGNRYRNIEKQREHIRKTLQLPHQRSLYTFLSRFSPET